MQRAQTLSYWSPTATLLGATSASGEKVSPFIVFRGEKVDLQMMNGAHAVRFYCNSNDCSSLDIFGGNILRCQAMKMKAKLLTLMICL